MVDRRSKTIRAMFGAIAPRYDLLNRLLSLYIDQYWRWLTARQVAHRLAPGSKVLDLCTGTGDLALLLAARNLDVIGCDFTHSMLIRAREKAQRRDPKRSFSLVEADALQMPFGSDEFDGLTVAFGFRNLENYDSGLNEIRRVLRPRGVAAILEFSEPRLPLVRTVFRFYFAKVLPRLGDWIAGTRGPYSYLPQSVREFPDLPAFSEMIRKAGFTDVQSISLTAGVACLYLARKTKASRPVDSEASQLEFMEPVR